MTGRAPGIRWIVETIRDNGPRQVYRWSITGRIVDTDGRDDRFSWAVPRLDDPRYDLSAILALCPACIGSIGGAHGGPDAPYRPALEGEPCGAADCQGAPDDDDDEPDAYEVWNATGSFPK